jgi:hypothetical protein
MPTNNEPSSYEYTIKKSKSKPETQNWTKNSNG